MEVKSKKLVLKDLSGKDVEFEIKTAVSQYEYETEIEVVAQTETSKAQAENREPDWFAVARKTENKTIETLIVKCSALEKVSGVEVKKLLPIQEFKRLKEALDQVTNLLGAEETTESKKG